MLDARRPVVIVLVLALLLPPGLALAQAPGTDDDGAGTRGSWTVTSFVEGTPPLEVNFEESRTNASYHVTVPNSATITSASVSLEGVQRYSLKGTPNSFADPVPHPHHAYEGYTKQYPPQNSPSAIALSSIEFSPLAEEAIQRYDGSVHQTSTSFQNFPPPHERAYHLLDFKVNKTGMVRLAVEWHGWGYCSGNKTFTHGADLWIWNYTSTDWEQLRWYEANDTGNVVHSFLRTFLEPYHYTSTYGHVNLVAFGQQDERNPLGFPDSGNVGTDYAAVTVLVNDTLEWPSDVEMAIGAQAPFWTHNGDLTGVVNPGAPEGFKDALQAYVDSIPPAPGSVRVPVVFRVGQATWGEVRVRSLAVAIREVDNQAPEFLGAEEVAMTEDEDLSRALDLRDHFTDDLQGSDLNYSVAFEENASAVHAEIHADGHHVNFVTTADDWAGTLTFRFTAADYWGLSATSTDFTVTVQEVNDPPVIVSPGDLFLEEDVPFELNITVLDPDVEYGDVLRFSDDSDLFDIDAGTGKAAFTPLQSDVGVYEVTVTVTDSHGVTDSDTFALTVVDINDRPSINDPGLLTAYEGRYFSYNFTATDEDKGDAFTWQLVGGIGSMFMGTQNGRLTWIPTSEHVGVVNVSVIAVDRVGAADQIAVLIDVINVNDAPEMGELEPVVLTEGLRVELVVPFTDRDLDVDPAETHTFTIDPPLFQVSANGSVDFIPSNDDVGVHSLTVTVTDAGSLSDSAQWMVEVLNTNQAPVLDPVEDQFWNEDEPVYLEVVARDFDPGDRITYIDVTSMFDIDPDTGVINFTPTQANVGTHTIELRARDRAGLMHTIFFEVTVLATNDPPVVGIRVETLKERLREGDMLSLAAEVSDEDNDRFDLIFSWTMDGRELGNHDSVTIRNLKPGDHVVTLRVEDGDNVVTASHAFSVEDVEEPFPWVGVLVAVVVLVVIAVVFVKVVRPLFARATQEKVREGGSPPPGY